MGVSGLAVVTHASTCVGDNSEGEPANRLAPDKRGHRKPTHYPHRKGEPIDGQRAQEEL